jgi:hypothetical protein
VTLSVYSFLPHRFHAAGAVPVVVIMHSCEVAISARDLGSGSRVSWAIKNKMVSKDMSAYAVFKLAQDVFVI